MDAELVSRVFCRPLLFSLFEMVWFVAGAIGLLAVLRLIVVPDP